MAGTIYYEQRISKMARWQDQELQSKTLLEVLSEVRQAISEGRYVEQEWDHNHDNRVDGRSNKQIKIAAGMLLGRPPKMLTQRQAWSTIYQALGFQTKAEV